MKQVLEQQIARAIVEDAVKAGYAISVHEGEDWAIIRSGDAEAIIKELGSTGEDTVHFYELVDGSVKHVGWVQIIWGNGCDLISNIAGDNDALDAICDRAAKIAEEASLKG